MKLFIFCSMLLVGWSVVAADTCTVSSLTQACRDFKPKAPARLDFGDGTYVTNFSRPTTGKLSQASDAVDSQRLKRAGELVIYARDTIIAIITDKHAPPLLADEQALIDKIKTVHYVEANDPKVLTEPNCQGEIGNASYSPINHSLTLCPNLLHYPDSAILAAVAHEFTHAVDSCRSQIPLYQAFPEKLPKVMPRDRGFKFLSMSEQIAKTDAAAPYINGGVRSLFDEALNPDSTHALEEMGVIKKVVDPIPFQQYPFREAYQCLTNGSHAFHTVKPSDARRFVSEMERQRRAQGESKADARAKVAAETKSLLARPECVRGVAPSQMTETMSDWMSAQVVGRYLKAHPPKTELEKEAPSILFTSLACMDKRQGANDGDGESRAAKKLDDPHAPAVQRANFIYLAEPATRAALGCSPANLKTACFDSYRAADEVAPNAKAPAAKATGAVK